VSDPSSPSGNRDASQSPFEFDDIKSIGAAFRGNMDVAYDYCRGVWLPETLSGIGNLERALSLHEMHDVMLLCEHLREDARSVGVRTLMTRLTDIECAARERDWMLATRLTSETAHYARSIYRWLARRSETPVNAAAAISEHDESCGLREHRHASRRRGCRRLGESLLAG
jgi:hypothetical protein